MQNGKIPWEYFSRGIYLKNTGTIGNSAVEKIERGVAGSRSHIREEKAPDKAAGSPGKNEAAERL